MKGIFTHMGILPTGPGAVLFSEVSFLQAMFGIKVDLRHTGQVGCVEGASGERTIYSHASCRRMLPVHRCQDGMCCIMACPQPSSPMP